MPTDRAPHNMTSNTAPSPYVTAGSTEYFPAWQAFNGTLNNYWLTNASASGTLSIDMGSGNTYIIGTYGIQANSIPEPNRMPKDWTLEGSNNGSDWDTLDTVTGATSWGNGEKRDYTCDVATTAYRYFRLNITANNGDTYLQVGELYLYEAEGGTTVVPLRMLMGVGT
jgi:hypothetical protein